MLPCRNQIWGDFARAWHEILDDMRKADLLSDEEVVTLEFVDLREGRPSTHGQEPDQLIRSEEVGLVHAAQHAQGEIEHAEHADTLPL